MQIESVGTLICTHKVYINFNGEHWYVPLHKAIAILHMLSNINFIKPANERFYKIFSDR